MKYGLEVTQDHSNWYHSNVWVQFPIRSSNYGSILHHVRDKAIYWSKIVIFSYPLHSTPQLGGGFLSNIAIPFGVEKLGWWSYLMVKKL